MNVTCSSSAPCAAGVASAAGPATAAVASASAATDPRGATVPLHDRSAAAGGTRAPHEHTEHGVRRPDPYHWLRDVDSPDVLAHLAAERAWYDTATGHLDSLVATLRSEMQARVPATDRSVSWRLEDCSYYTVLPAGREHPQLLRDLHLPVTEDSVPETGRAAPRRRTLLGRRLRVRRAGSDQRQPRRATGWPTRST